MKDLLTHKGDAGLGVIVSLLGLLTIGGAELRQAKLDARWAQQNAAQPVEAAPVVNPQECLIPRDVLANPALAPQFTKNCKVIKVVEATAEPVGEVQEIKDAVKVEKAAPKTPVITKETEKKTIEFLEELRRELEKRNAAKALGNNQ
jgi:hypothetical protein